MPQIDPYGTVSGVSGYVPVSSPYEGSLSNPIPGWNIPPTIQHNPYKKFQFLSDDKRAHVRFEDDEEGPHVHYDDMANHGFRLKIYVDGVSTYAEFQRKAPEIKHWGNGFIKSVRELFYGKQDMQRFIVNVSLKIMRLCPNCSSEINVQFQECPHCGKQLKWRNKERKE